MNKELYDKILILMSIDSAYEKDFGYRYIHQETFDKLLQNAGVDYPDMEYVKERLEILMDNLEEFLLERAY